MVVLLRWDANLTPFSVTNYRKQLSSKPENKTAAESTAAVQKLQDEPR
jgi:hypothetical protein